MKVLTGRSIRIYISSDSIIGVLACASFTVGDAIGRMAIQIDVSHPAFGAIATTVETLEQLLMQLKERLQVRLSPSHGRHNDCNH